MKTQQTEKHININEPEWPYTIQKSNYAPAQPQDAASHSPLPWTSKWSEGDVEHHVLGAPKADGFCEIVAQVLRTDNAAFIVRACNNAQRLADALEQVRAMI